MLVLGIESSCDETAASIVENGRNLKSNIVASSLSEHKKFGGVVPEIASRRHAECISRVVSEALNEADCTINDLGAVAVTYAPGLIGSLLVGVGFAKGLAFAAQKPLVPVHHIRSHIAANYLTSDLKPPFMCLSVSGGSTVIVCVEDYTKYKIIGKTRDDAAGEALDKAGRTLGLEYPGGVSIDKISTGANADAFNFPHPYFKEAPYDFSFSGIKTSLINKVHNLKQKGENFSTPDMAASFQKTVVDILVSDLERAARDFNYKTIALSGGVSANSLLRKSCLEMCKRNNFKLYIPKKEFCGDNGAMVASQGFYEYSAGVRGGADLNAYATMSIDDVVCKPAKKQ